MLRKIRIVIATVLLAGITALFLDLSGALHAWLGWMAKIQFLPAVMACNLVVIAILALLTLIFGRVYCSVICPLGIFQDLISWISSRRKGKKARFHYVKEHKWLRYGFLVVFIVALVIGLQPLVALLAPYSAYGRMVQSLLAPLWQWGNNLLAVLSERIGTYTFYTREVWIRSLPVLLVAAITFVAIVWLAWKGGRTYCNSICPVGTTLSFLSRIALFRPVIDVEKCRDCHACEHKCKASCIDISGGHNIDYSRCVDCFDCIDSCKFGALKYRFAYCKKSGEKETRKRAEDNGRRAFLASAALVTVSATVGAQEKKLDGGFATIIAKKKPERTNPLTPFGSKSIKDFYSRCTACQLCVSACPNNVLRPSGDLKHFMQPEMSYEKGYCRPECTVCSDICPSGAIIPITPEEKTSYRIGTAVVDRSLCIAENGTYCGNCARHCPANAIKMVRTKPEDKNSPVHPVVNEDACIGCGACENLCPSRPYSAIHVDGLHSHTK